MSVTSGAPQAPFLAQLFHSTAIKSWVERDAPALRAALVSAIAHVSDGAPVIIDLLVDLEAVMLEPIVEAANVVHWRSRPSRSFGARARRLLGFYSGESTLGAAVQLAGPAQLSTLLVGDVLWNCEFTVYPPPDRAVSELPDPHFHVPGFARHVAWSLMQDAGSEAWMVTALDQSTLSRVCAALTQAFTSAGLPCALADGPKFT